MWIINALPIIKLATNSVSIHSDNEIIGMNCVAIRAKIIAKITRPVVFQAIVNAKQK